MLNVQFQSAKANEPTEKGYPAWMSLSDADLLASSNSIQVLLGKIGILAEEMARQCEPHRHIVSVWFLDASSPNEHNFKPDLSFLEET